ncbi:MAG: TonB-dependent receptor [Acidobacteriota bacterium]
MQFQAHKKQKMQFCRYAATCLAVLAGFLMLSAAAQAQILYGSLTGAVTDPSKATVPGASVEALNVGTGVAKQATTDERGVFLFTDLLPGIYRVTISAPSFSRVVTENVNVAANTVRRVDVQLQLAKTNEAITVEAGTATLQTDRADVSTQLAATQLATLPMTSSAGRNFQALYKFVPGFSMVTEGVSSDGGNPMRAMTGNVNGNSMQGNLTRIDGASNLYIWLPFNAAYVPPAESIESVSVVTNSFDAEQGGAPGAIVSVVTKSGTNQFHGSAFEYHTDNALKAINRFNPAGFRKPKYIMNQYGGAIGGPIKQNKLFFFADWEGLKRRMLASNTKSVINPAGIFDSSGNANFSSSIPAGTDCNVTHVAGCIYDPNTGNANGTGRTAFAGNIIPASRIDPAAKIILGRISTAGFLNSTGATATSNYNSTGSAKMDRDTIDSKVNYLPNSRTMIFGRYSISRATLFDPPVLGQAMGGATGGGQVGTAPSQIQNVGLGGTYTFTARMLADVNVAYTRQRLGATYAPDLDLGNFGVNTLHIPGTNGDTYLAQGTPAFIFTVGGWNGMGNSDTGNPFLFRDNQYVANANLSWMKGRHDLRYGVEYTASGMNHFQPQGGAFQTPRGSFRFSGNVTALSGGKDANGTNSVADYLLGLPTEVGKAVQNANPNSLRWKTWSMYVRDRWQIIPKLTLTYGLRWEYYPFATTDHGGVKLFNPATGNILIGGNGSVPLNDGVDVGHGQVLPRVGLAYRIGSKTVIRAGYGMSADSNNWRFFRNNYPATTNSDVTATATYYPAGSLTGETLVPYPGLTAGIPTVAIPDISSGVIATPNNVNPGNTVPFNFRRGYIHSYNLTLQHEFSGFVAEAAYVGTRGIRTLTNENINAAPINGGNAGRLLYPVANKNWGDFNSLSPDTNSYYDALQTKLTKRLSGGSMIGAIYTFSKAINSDDNEEVSGTFGVDGGYLFWAYPAYRFRNKALASYDRTHNFQFYGVYGLPFGPNKHWAMKGVLGQITGGWQLNWALTKTSGNPLTLKGGGTQINSPGNYQTPDQVGPVRILGGIGPAPITGLSVSCAPTDMSCHYFDPTAFAAVPASQIRFGTAGRNFIRGPGFFNLDASLFKDFKITERVKFQFKMEVFGVTNTPHYGNPGVDVTNTAQFGVITSTLNLAGRGSGLGGERQFWFSGKVTF